MNCPECGAPVGADEKFCGNCGTPLPASKPDADDAQIDQDQPGLVDQPQDNAAPAFDPAAAPEDETLVTGNSGGEETIYSEPTPLPMEPMPLPVQEAYVPDPAGSSEELITPAPAPPPPVERAPAGQRGSRNMTIVIAIIVLVILLLCCCIALIAGILLFGTTEGGAPLSMAMPGLLAAI